MANVPKDPNMLGKKRYSSPPNLSDSQNPIENFYIPEVKKEEGELTRSHVDKDRTGNINKEVCYPENDERFPRDDKNEKFEGNNKNKFYEKDSRRMTKRPNYEKYSEKIEKYENYDQEQISSKRNYTNNRSTRTRNNENFKRETHLHQFYEDDNYRRNPNRIKSDFREYEKKESIIQFKRRGEVEHRNNDNIRVDVDHRRGDVDHRRGDVDHRRGDVDHRRGDVDHRRGDVDNRRGGVDHRRGDELNARRKPRQERDRSYSYSDSELYGDRDSSRSSNSRSKSQDSRKVKIEKKFNFLMVLPKNYFRFIEQDYTYLFGEIKKKIRDQLIFQYDYKISGCPDYVLRLDSSKVSSKALAMKIVCDSLFDAMKQTYQNMSYLKVSILVPSHVVGFIIGIEGKNINNIRDISAARIDIYQNDINNKYRQIELQGSPESISKASEKIYKIVNKYYFFSSSDRKDERVRPRHRLRNENRENINRSYIQPERKVLRIRLGKDRRTSSKIKRTSGDTKYEDKRNFVPRARSHSPAYNEMNEKKLSLTALNVNLSENNISSVQKIEPINTNQNNLDDIENIVPISNSNNSEEEKMPINIIITNQSLNMLKNIKGNIFIEIENKYHCSISKKVEKLSNNDVNILTLSGTPKQNCMAIYCLQQAMTGKLDFFKN